MTASSKRPTSHLQVVPHPVGDSEVYDLMRKPESTTERVKRLQLEARMLAREQVASLEAALMAVAHQAEEIALGGDAYPVGAREVCRSLIEELHAKAMTLQAISYRA
jgi:hypothetical protein